MQSKWLSDWERRFTETSIGEAPSRENRDSWSRPPVRPRRDTREMITLEECEKKSIRRSAFHARRRSTRPPAPPSARCAPTRATTAPSSRRAPTRAETARRVPAATGAPPRSRRSWWTTDTGGSATSRAISDRVRWRGASLLAAAARSFSTATGAAHQTARARRTTPSPLTHTAAKATRDPSAAFVSTVGNISRSQTRSAGTARRPPTLWCYTSVSSSSCY